MESLRLLVSSHAHYISLQEHFNRTLTVAFKRYRHSVESAGEIRVTVTGLDSVDAQAPVYSHGVHVLVGGCQIRCHRDIKSH
jgi:hypothetical protein